MALWLHCFEGMKNNKNWVYAVLMGAILPACSVLQPATDKDISARGPTVINARVEPGTIELNRSLQPTQTPEVIADVKDFHSKVDDVRLKFNQVNVEVPMRNIGGTTWRGELTSSQLRSLAVSDKTMRYEATVVAKDEAGQTAASRDTVKVAVKTPDLSKSSTG